jgi:hypothetical protein
MKALGAFALIVAAITLTLIGQPGYAAAVLMPAFGLMVLTIG